MPPGLKNSYNSFSRTMHLILRDAINKYCLVDMGNLIVFSKSLDEHLVHLDKVLEALDKHKFRVVLEKCRLVQSELTYNNNLFKENKVVFNYRTLEIIQNWPIPKSEKNFNDFIEFISQFGSKIENYSRLMSPFEDILSGKSQFLWNKSMMNSFEQIKLNLVKLLSMDLKSQEATKIILYVYFNQFRYVCVVVQQDKRNTHTPIAFVQKKIPGVIHFQGTTFFKNNQLPCIQWAIKEYKSLVGNVKFQVSYKNFKMANENELQNDANINEWIYKSQCYDIDIEHTIDVNKTCLILSRVNII